MTATRLTALWVSGRAEPAFLDPFARPTNPVQLSTTSVSTLDEAQTRLTAEEFDVVLLEAEAQPQTFQQIASLRRTAPGIALIVITELESVSDVVRFVRAGADDAVRNPPDPFELQHAIILAIERRASIGREGALLVRFAATPPTSVTAQMFGGTSLRNAEPEAFAELANAYAEIMELAIEERTYKKAQEVPSRLRDLAERLGTLRASPRDIVEMHTAALGEKFHGGRAGRVQAYVEEGKLLLLELMGDVVSFYRSYAAVFWTRARAGAPK